MFRFRVTKLLRVRTIFLAPLVLFALFYGGLVVFLLLPDPCRFPGAL